MTYSAPASAAPAKRATRSVERPSGPDDQRLEEPSLGIAADDTEREERRQDDPEKERREHREAEDRRPGQRLRVDADLARLGGEALRLTECPVSAEAVEGQESGSQDQDNDEDAASHRLAKRIPDDDPEVPHSVSPTASR